MFAANRLVALFFLWLDGWSFVEEAAAEDSDGSFSSASGALAPAGTSTSITSTTTASSFAFADAAEIDELFPRVVLLCVTQTFTLSACAYSVVPVQTNARR